MKLSTMLNVSIEVTGDNRQFCGVNPMCPFSDDPEVGDSWCYLFKKEMPILSWDEELQQGPTLRVKDCIEKFGN